MSITFNLGINKLPAELDVMQLGGLYWLCIEEPLDAYLLREQLIINQSNRYSIAAITMGADGSNGDEPSSCTRYVLPLELKAFEWLEEDLRRMQQADHSLLVLVMPSEIPHRLTAIKFKQWVMRMNSYLSQKDSTLLVLSVGSFSHMLESDLLDQHRNLMGLATLNEQSATDHTVRNYHIQWWANNSGVSANHMIALEYKDQITYIKDLHEGEHKEEADINTQDSHRYYATETVLEGAPPLSEYWTLFPDNAELARNVLSITAATVIFEMNKETLLPTIATDIYSLRRARGNSVKIVIRELMPCLRYHDERILIACGANLIVPSSESLSRFLTQLEEVQGMRFQRTLANNLDALLRAMRPIENKGLVDFSLFNSEIMRLMENPYEPSNSKGVLIAFKLVEGITPMQVFTLCHFRRDGDLALIVQHQLYLFLSSCRINDVPKVLQALFRLPITEIFINTTHWYRDKDIINELSQIKTILSSSKLSSSSIITDHRVDLPQSNGLAPVIEPKIRIQPIRKPLVLMDEVVE